MNEDEHRLRVKNLQRQMRINSLDACFLFQQTDIFYFSGNAQDSILYIPTEGEPLLLVKRSNVRTKEEEISLEYVPLQGRRNLISILEKHRRLNLQRVGLELDVLPVSEYLLLRELAPKTEFTDISRELLEIRSLKSEQEIKLMRKAARVAYAGQEEVSDVLKEGMKEIELASLVEARMRREGHQGFVRMRRWNQEVFYGHIVTGENGTLPSYMLSPTGGKGVSGAVPAGAGWRKIKRDQPTMVDMVGAFEGYLCDVSRTYVLGKLPKELEVAYSTTGEIMDTLIDKLRPKSLAKDTFSLAVGCLLNDRQKDGFMGCTEDRVKFIGHGIGLELDEPPALTKRNPTVLQEGMTLALEPKIAFPDLGIVGFEETFVLQKEGLRSLGNADGSFRELPLGP